MRFARGRFCLLLLIAAVLSGCARVHIFGYGRKGAAGAAFPGKSELEGFIYKAPWNKEGELTFISGKLRILVKLTSAADGSGRRLEKGAFVRIRDVYLKEPSPPRNPGVFDYRLYLLSRGVTLRTSAGENNISLVNMNAANILPGIFHLPGAFLRFHISEVMKNAVGEDAGKLSAAIMTGDTGSLDGDTKSRFRNGGISHLLAVSGMHVTYILLPFRLLGMNRRTGIGSRYAIMLLPLAAFASVADFSCSVMRASVSFCFTAGAALSGRPPDRFNALCFSAALQIFARPFVVFNSGFILSHLAVAGLIFAAPLISRLLGSEKYREKRGIRQIKLISAGSLASGISVNLFLLPAGAVMFGSVVPAGILTTVYASPLAASICAGGYAFSFLMLLDRIVIFRPLCLALGNILRGLCTLAELIASLGNMLPPPLGTLSFPKPGPIFAFACYGVLFVLMTGPGKEMRERLRAYFGERVISGKRRRTAAAVSLAAFIAVSSAAAVRSAPLLEALVIDVGQGSSMLVKAGGYAGVVDTGDGRTDIAAVVRANGTVKLDFVILSHGHADHTGGLQGIISAFEPATLYISEDSGEGLLRAEAAALDAGWKVVPVGNGDSLELGPVRADFFVAEKFFGGRSDADENNASLCVRFSCVHGSLTVAGDLQSEGEEELLRGGAFTRTDVLIAPHHGSSSGSGAKLLSRTGSEYVIISAGAANSYGHPAKETLSRIEAAGASALRTDTGGGITVKIGRPGIFWRKRVRIWQTL